jgi:tRNA pseudouridine55 synthase
MKKSQIEIFDFQITRCQPPEIDFEITCSKGTYIRTIAHEFGQRLKSGSYLQSLRRTKSLPFDVKDAVSVDEWCDFFWKWKNFEK